MLLNTLKQISSSKSRKTAASQVKALWLLFILICLITNAHSQRRSSSRSYSSRRSYISRPSYRVGYHSRPSYIGIHSLFGPSYMQYPYNCLVKNCRMCSPTNPGVCHNCWPGHTVVGGQCQVLPTEHCRVSGCLTCNPQSGGYSCDQCNLDYHRTLYVQRLYYRSRYWYGPNVYQCYTTFQKWWYFFTSTTAIILIILSCFVICCLCGALKRWSRQRKERNDYQNMQDVVRQRQRAYEDNEQGRVIGGTPNMNYPQVPSQEGSTQKVTPNFG